MSKDHYRTNGDDWHEWSTDTTDQVVKDKPSRMFLRVDATGMFMLEEDLVTSDKPTARALDSEHGVSLCLTSANLEWLQRVIPLALAAEQKWQTAESEDKK